MSPLNHSYSGKKRPRGRKPPKPTTPLRTAQPHKGLANTRRSAWKKLLQILGSAPPESKDLKSTRIRSINPVAETSRPKLAANRSAPLKVAASQTRSRKQRPKSRRTSPLIYISRLAILGVGLGAIAGTVLASWNPKGHIPAQKSAPTAQGNPVVATSSQPKSVLGQEILPLKTQIQAIAAKYPQLRPQAFLVDLDGGNYIDLSGSLPISAASTIKVPIVVALLQDVDAGKVRLDELLTLTPNAIGSGSGSIQYQKLGSKFSVLEVATKTITISDNTATNMLIERLGGIEKLNSRFRSWGLISTSLKNPLPDLEGTNMTSPKDLVELMAMVNRGELVTMRSRDRLLGIMRQTITNTLLPQGLGKGATIAHKTGDIGSVVGDVGLIDMPSGKRYLAAVMVKRPHNNPKGQELIRQISRFSYNYLDSKSPQASNPNELAAPVVAPLRDNSPVE